MSYSNYFHSFWKTYYLWIDWELFHFVNKINSIFLIQQKTSIIRESSFYNTTRKSRNNKWLKTITVIALKLLNYFILFFFFLPYLFFFFLIFFFLFIFLCFMFKFFFFLHVVDPPEYSQLSFPFKNNLLQCYLNIFNVGEFIKLKGIEYFESVLIKKKRDSSLPIW